MTLRAISKIFHLSHVRVLSILRKQVEENVGMVVARERKRRKQDGISLFN